MERMEIEDDSFSGEVGKAIMNYYNLVSSNCITQEMIFDEFVELFSCDVYIKNGLTAKVKTFNHSKFLKK